MKSFICGLPKKYGYRFLGVLLITKACARNKIHAILLDNWMTFVLPDTKMVTAVWLAYINGRYFGYSLGGVPPHNGVTVFPKEK